MTKYPQNITFGGPQAPTHEVYQALGVGNKNGETYVRINNGHPLLYLTGATVDEQGDVILHATDADVVLFGNDMILDDAIKAYREAEKQVDRFDELHMARELIDLLLRRYQGTKRPGRQ